MGAVCTDWDAVLALLPDIDVVLYDRPGTGHSPPPRPGWPDAPPSGLTEEVQRIAETCRAVGAGPPYVLVGHSFGGLHAQAFARLRPAETAGAVLVDSSLPTSASTRQSPPGGGRLLRAAGRSPLPGVVGPAAQRLLLWTQTHRATDPLPRAERNRILGSPAVGRAIVAELLAFDAVAQHVASLARTHPFPQVPTAVLAAGSTGRPLRRVSRSSVWEQAALVRLLGTGELHRVDGAAHMIPLDRPDAVAEKIRTVLRAVDDGAEPGTGLPDRPRAAPSSRVGENRGAR
jgi:pimeloyl-ACP methyl ester carboxylesterase